MYVCVCVSLCVSMFVSVSVYLCLCGKEQKGQRQTGLYYSHSYQLLREYLIQWFSSSRLWPLWGVRWPCHSGQLRPSENTNISIAVHNNRKDYSYKVAIKIILWLGSPHDLHYSQCCHHKNILRLHSFLHSYQNLNWGLNTWAASALTDWGSIPSLKKPPIFQINYPN